MLLVDDRKGFVSQVLSPFAQLIVGALPVGVGLLPLSLELGTELERGRVRPTVASRLRLQWLDSAGRLVLMPGAGGRKWAIDVESGVALFDGSLFAPYVHLGGRIPLDSGPLAFERFTVLGNRLSIDLSPNISVGIPGEVVFRDWTFSGVRAYRLGLEIRHECCSPALE